MKRMRYNSGPEFVHPVTHRVVSTGAWYEGAAHQEHENGEEPYMDPEQIDGNLTATNDVLTENASGLFVCERCGKEYKTQKGWATHVAQCPQQPTDVQDNPPTDVQNNAPADDQNKPTLTPQEQGQVIENAPTQ